MCKFLLSLSPVKSFHWRELDYFCFVFFYFFYFSLSSARFLLYFSELMMMDCWMRWKKRRNIPLPIFVLGRGRFICKGTSFMIIHVEIFWLHKKIALFWQRKSWRSFFDKFQPFFLLFVICLGYRRNRRHVIPSRTWCYIMLLLLYFNNIFLFWYIIRRETKNVTFLTKDYCW